MLTVKEQKGGGRRWQRGRKGKRKIKRDRARELVRVIDKECEERGPAVEVTMEGKRVRDKGREMIAFDCKKALALRLHRNGRVCEVGKQDSNH